MKTDIYKEVTDKILAELKTGAAPWIQPWSGKGMGGAMPRNAATKRAYNGINVVLLWMGQQENGYASNEWLTFKQAKAVGGNIRKGEKGTRVVFVSAMEKEETNGGGDTVTRRIPFLKKFTVFNVAQCENLPENMVGALVEPRNNDSRELIADEFITATGAGIVSGGGRACYSPSQDAVYMPAFETFKNADNFYATMFHELGHWTGHKTRLNRDLKGRFGDHSYAAEELIAELSAAFLCAEFGFDNDLRHAGYIEHWIKMLQDDSRAFMTAASKAQAVADYMRDIALADPVQEAA